MIYISGLMMQSGIRGDVVTSSCSRSDLSAWNRYKLHLCFLPEILPLPKPPALKQWISLSTWGPQGCTGLSFSCQLDGDMLWRTGDSPRPGRQAASQQQVNSTAAQGASVSVFPKWSSCAWKLQEAFKKWNWASKLLLAFPNVSLAPG